MLAPLTMSNSEKEASDHFLKEKEFDLSGGVDLSKFIEDGVLKVKENAPVEKSIKVILFDLVSLNNISNSPKS